MADKRCDNGHFIDESWDLCPYCPQEIAEPEMSIVRPREDVPPLAPPPLVSPPVTAAVAPERSKSSSEAGSEPARPAERTVAGSKLDIQKRYVVGWLVGLSGNSRGESFTIRMGKNLLGRDRRSDIVVDDEQASAHHADLIFRPDEKRFILIDANSTNGTYVNEAEVVARRDLAGRDVIRIGSQRYVFMPLCGDGVHWDGGGLLE